MVINICEIYFSQSIAYNTKHQIFYLQKMQLMKLADLMYANKL